MIWLLLIIFFCFVLFFFSCRLKRYFFYFLTWHIKIFIPFLKGGNISSFANFYKMGNTYISAYPLFQVLFLIHPFLFVRHFILPIAHLSFFHPFLIHPFLFRAWIFFYSLNFLGLSKFFQIFWLFLYLIS